MSYSIIILPKSEREIKRLNKKYRSFKADTAELITLLQESPSKAKPLVKTAIRYAWLSLLKEKKRVVEPE